jgi:DNA polymerase-3 subunit gamma/tau
VRERGDGARLAMSYQVIARKYRPQRFDDVVGQEHVTRTLTRAIEQNRIAHAYLFCGPRGTGKTTIARIFAKCLNCSGGPKVGFPDDDPRALEIAEGRSLDVLEIDAASNRGIDEIRGLRETVKYAPASGKFKVYIIDEVHMLTKEAFNALLKTLEEPPAHVKFMFATTEPEKVLPTILSRCQRFDLRRIPASLIVQHLGEIARKEKVQIDAPALHAIARGAEGGMRDAESTLDQLISFCGSNIEEADVLSMFGLTAQAQVMQLARAVIVGEAETVLRGFNELAGQGKDLARLLADLLGHFRNLLVYQISKGDQQLLEVTEAESAALAEAVSQVGTSGLTQILEVLSDAELRLRDAASKKILVEVALLKAMDARQSVSIETILRQLEALRAGEVPLANPAPAPPLKGHRPAPQASSTSPAPATAVAPLQLQEGPASPAAPLASSLEPEELWNQLVEAVGRESRFLRSYLMEAHLVSVTEKVAVIGFPPEHEEHIALVDNPKNQALIQAKLVELGRPSAQVKFTRSDLRAARPAAPTASPERPAKAAPTIPPAAGPASPAASKPAEPAREKPTPVPFNKDDFKNDPAIQKALELFKGQIVDVRA